MIKSPKPTANPKHRHSNIDRTTSALFARLTGRVSPFALTQGWGDWALHLSRAPGRQFEPLEHAQKNALDLMMDLANGDKDSAPPFAPKEFDNRFTDPAWKQFPFRA